MKNSRCSLRLVDIEAKILFDEIDWDNTGTINFSKATYWVNKNAQSMMKILKKMLWDWKFWTLAIALIAEMIRLVQILVPEYHTQRVKTTRYLFKIISSVLLFAVGVQILLWSKRGDRTQIDIVKRVKKELGIVQNLKDEFDVDESSDELLD